MTDELNTQINEWLDRKGITGSTRETFADAMRQARAQYDSIAEMVAKFKAARDGWPCFFEHTDGRFYALADSDELEEFENFDGDESDRPEKPESFTREELDEEHDSEWLELSRGDEEPDEDEAREEMENDALSVQVRSGWHTPGETAGPDEFEILLCTGGPAVRITGGLGRYCDPENPTLEFQGWFIPWTVLPGFMLPDDSDEVLAEFCGVFYYGAG